MLLAAAYQNRQSAPENTKYLHMVIEHLNQFWLKKYALGC